MYSEIINYDSCKIQQKNLFAIDSTFLRHIVERIPEQKNGNTGPFQHIVEKSQVLPYVLGCCLLRRNAIVNIVYNHAMKNQFVINKLFVTLWKELRVRLLLLRVRTSLLRKLFLKTLQKEKFGSNAQF